MKSIYPNGARRATSWPAPLLCSSSHLFSPWRLGDETNKPQGFCRLVPCCTIFSDTSSISLHIYTYIYTYCIVLIYILTHIYIYMIIYVYIYTYCVYIHIYIYIYIHAYAWSASDFALSLLSCDTFYLYAHLMSSVHHQFCRL